MPFLHPCTIAIPCETGPVMRCGIPTYQKFTTTPLLLVLLSACISFHPPRRLSDMKCWSGLVEPWEPQVGSCCCTASALQLICKTMKQLCLEKAQEEREWREWVNGLQESSGALGAFRGTVLLCVLLNLQPPPKKGKKAIYWKTWENQRWLPKLKMKKGTFWRHTKSPSEPLKYPHKTASPIPRQDTIITIVRWIWFFTL